MRGTGKTFVGNMVASLLSWPFVDADTYFEQKHKIGVREFVHQHGWPAFREAENVALSELIQKMPLGHIISLGGGIVETESARKILKEYTLTKGPVVHIMRPIDEVVAYLNAETARPAYEEPIENVFRRREPWFAQCSNYIFDNHFGVDATSSASSRRGTATEVSRFFKHITGQQPNLALNLSPKSRSYFLSLTYPDVTESFPHIEELTQGVDALELRVDLLHSPKDDGIVGTSIPSLAYVQQQVSALRRVSSLPIVYTVRTKSQGGAFPDAAVKEAVEFLQLGLQVGVEYLDVEITLPEKSIRELNAQKGFSKIIASWHDWSGKVRWDSPLMKEKYDVASSLGDIIKIVSKASSIEDNFVLNKFVSAANAQPKAKPIIAINMGGEGQMSRILNPTFSPVSHPLLPNKAAPGQLSFRQIQQALHLIGCLPSRSFYLFGTPISQSMSPTLHNTGFNILGLPHQYQLLETRELGHEIKAAITAPEFGGASVTIPYKLDIIPLLDKLTPAAKAIGAVNTIIPQGPESERVLVGDNTDWLGITASITGGFGGQAPIHAALVIGAGGTARAAIYALQALNAQVIYLFNRTIGKAEELAHAFPEARIKVVERLGDWPSDSGPPNIIVSTVPAAATTTSEKETGLIPLSEKIFAYREGLGVVVDMAYRPAETPLLKLAKEAGGQWVLVPGLEVLLQQGYAQFQLWTGRSCPKGLVAKRVREGYNNQI
jgi:pentafunctional AROM polypeptide